MSVIRSFPLLPKPSSRIRAALFVFWCPCQT
jgi:hypothetical protein